MKLEDALDNLMPIAVIVFIVFGILAVISIPFLMYFNPCTYKTCVIIETKEIK